MASIKAVKIVSERFAILDSFGENIGYYRKRGSASYIVREVHSVRERDTERERE